jgi:hypothetical protein
MTIFQALYIKYLRVRCDGTWRWVAGKYSQRYDFRLPFTDESTYGGDQFEGMNLCHEAMELLGESTENGWN